MSNIAELINENNGKFILKFRGHRLMHSDNKQYIIDHWREKGKTKKYSITEIVDKTSKNDVSAPEVKVEFDINERFDFLTQLTNMVANRNIVSLIVTGSPGLGKTHTVLDAIKSTHEDFYHVKGFSTPKSLYRILYEHNGSLIVFDDCDSILDNDTAINLLKSALDSYDKRTIHWHSETMKDLETEFDFYGRIIFISNRDRKKMDEAVVSRSIVVDLTMNVDEKIERMEAILPEIRKDINIEYRQTAMEFVKKRKNSISDLSIRTLLKVINVYNGHMEGSVKGDWERLAEYAINN